MAKVTVDLQGNANEFVSQINTLTDDMDTLNKGTKQLNDQTKKGFTESTKAAEGFNKKVKSTTDARKKEVGIIAQINAELKKLKSAREAATSTAGIKKLNKEIDNQEKKLRGLVGATNKVSVSFKDIAKGALAFAGISAGIELVKSGFTKVIKTVGDYDKATSELKAITGLDGKEFDAFDKKIKEVATNSKKSAIDVAKAFQLIGSANADLLNSADALGLVTDAAITLAKAGGLEVPEAADALTKSMNQFGAAAEDAAEFTDILAASQQKGTATISQLSESMKNVGAIANAAGISFKDTTIHLQALAKGGLTGAEAGTGLRGVYAKLAAQGRDDLNPTLRSMSEITRTLAAENLDLKGASELVGIEGAKTVLTLIAQQETMDKLGESMNDVSGSASEQAITATANLNDKWEEFGNQIDNAIIGMAAGEGSLSDFLGVLVDFGSEVLAIITGTQDLEKELDSNQKTIRKTAQIFVTFVKVLGAAIIAFKAFQFAMKAGAIIQKAINAATVVYSTIQKLLQGGLKASATAQRILNFAMNANPIGILILAITGLIAAYYAFSDSATDAEISQEQLTKAQERASKVSKKRFGEIKAETQALLDKALIDSEIAKSSAVGADAEKKIDDDLIVRNKEIIAQEKQKNILRTQAVGNRSEELVKGIDLEIAAFKKQQDEIVSFGGKGGDAQARAAKTALDRKIKAAEAEKNLVIGTGLGILEETKKRNAELDALTEGFNNEQIIEANETSKEISAAQKKANEKAAAEAKRAGDKRIKELEKLQKEFQKSVAKLAKEADDQAFNDLEGVDKIQAQKKRDDAEIDLLEQTIREKGRLLSEQRTRDAEIRKGSSKEQIEIAVQEAGDLFEITKEQTEQLALLKKASQEKELEDIRKFNTDKKLAEIGTSGETVDIREAEEVGGIDDIENNGMSEIDFELFKQIKLLEIQKKYTEERIALLDQEIAARTEAAQADGVIDAQEQNQIDSLELQKRGLDKSVDQAEDAIEDLEKQKGKTSLAELFGMSEEDFNGVKDALSQTYDAVLDGINQILEAEAEAAEIRIEALGEREDEVRDELDTELALNAQGFASNVQGKQEELNAITAAKKKAQKDAADIAKKQLIVDTIAQSVGLITTSINILEGFSKIPIVGLPLGIAAVAAMIAFFVSAKAKAFSAVGSTAATGASGEGSTGTIHGKRHYQGGERFTDNLEVEHGEKWGILSRGATTKHGKFFEKVTMGLNDGRNPDELMNDLLHGTGIYLKRDADQKIENRTVEIRSQELVVMSDMRNEAMENSMDQTAKNTAKLLEYETNKKEIIPTPDGRWEIDRKNNKKTFIKYKDNG
jgi:TP901 family phage tail tape measure protein